VQSSILKNFALIRTYQTYIAVLLTRLPPLTSYLVN